MDGVLSKFLYKFESSILEANTSSSVRCTTNPKNFDDDPSAILRSRNHTEALLDAFGQRPRILWDGYGIIADVMVRLHVTEDSDT